MNSPDSHPKAGRASVPDWRLKSVRRSAALLLVCAALVVQAEAPRAKSPAKPLIPNDPLDNVFSAASVLPANLRRVLMLPLASEGTSTERIQGCETLGPILQAELGKTGRFEVVGISRENLRGQTGRSSWSGTETLPANFFDSLQRVSGCDAVLFCELTRYRPYAPLAVGWRLKLVDVRSRQILWAVDEMFDADHPAVAKELKKQRPSKILEMFDWNGTGNGTKDAWLMDHSPRQFGRYTAGRVVATLPGRQEIAKVSWPSTDDTSAQPLNDKAANQIKAYGN